MSLGKALAKERDRPDLRGPKCSVCTLMSVLPKGEQEALQSALSDPVFTSAAISRALRSEGHQIGSQSMQRHRRGECRSIEP